MADRRPPGAIRVLVVDDEAEVAETTGAFLSRHDEAIEVTTATSAAAGLERLAADRFDCVVSDYSMPDTDGLEFFAAARGRHPGLPFVLFTGKGSEEIASRAISAGVTDYLQKTGRPEQYERLANRVAHATDARRAERDAAETRAHLGAIVESAQVVILTIDESSTIQFVNQAVEPVFGYPPEAVEGEPLTRLMPERFRDRHHAGIRRYLDTGERQVDWNLVEFPGQHRDGHEVPLSISFSEFTRDGETYFTGIIRDISGRQRREARLAGLNQLLAGYMEIEDRHELCASTVEAAADRLALPVTAVALFDDEAGGLRLVAQTSAADEGLDGPALVDQDGGLAWEAFTAGEPTVVEAPGDDLVDASLGASELRVYPLGRHGVFVTAVEAVDGAAAEVDFIENVAASLHVALDRVEREELLRIREERLEEQNEWLDQLNRLNDVIRRVDRVLVGAATREEIERTVCAELADDGPYRFAWVGSVDVVGDRVEPCQWAGVESGFLDVRSAMDDPDDPTSRAARTSEAAVEPDVLGEPPLDGWRTAALDHGFRSCVAVPLYYRDRTYGVLTVYADRPNAFDELEQAVLQEFGSTIGYAINAIEARRALVSEAVVELEFEVQPEAFPLLEELGLAVETTFELEGLIPDDGGYRVFFTLRNAPDDVADRLDRSPVVEQWTRLARWESASLFECRVAEDSFVAWLLSHGAIPRGATLNDRAQVRVELGQDADVRAFVELFRAAHPETDLVARREHERPVRTRESFLAELGDALTARQLEVLQAAFYSGYFEAPRHRTGQEVAASLGISQPTFSDHLRAALRKLLGMAFSSDRDDE